MNRKQLIILLVLGVAIGGAGLFLYKRQKDSYKVSDATIGQKLLPDFPINDVAHIVVKQGTNELNLAREGDIWVVRERHNYPADYGNLTEVVRKLWELKAVQSVEVGASQLGRLELSPPGPGPNTGTLIEFKDKSGKDLRALTLGKKYMRESPGGSPFGGGGDFPAGRYVMVSGKPDVWLISDPLTNLEPKPESWLNKDFVRVEKLRSIAVTSTNATNNWKITRETETGEWKLADKQEGEELDNSKVSGLSYAFSSPTFNDVLPPTNALAGLGLDQPVTATLETFDNFVYHVKISHNTNDENIPITLEVQANLDTPRTPGKDEKPEDKEKLDKEHKEKVDKLKEKLAKEKKSEKWIYLVSKWTVDPLLKHRHDLLADKKEEKKDTTTTDPAAAPAVAPAAIPGVPDGTTPPPLPEGAQSAPKPAPAPEAGKAPGPAPVEPKKPD